MSSIWPDTMFPELAGIGTQASDQMNDWFLLMYGQNYGCYATCSL